MNAYSAYTNVSRHSHETHNGRPSFGIFALIIATLAVLSISGCVGAVGSTSTSTTPGSGAAGKLVPSAASLTFGPVAAGSSSIKTLTITNSGAATVTISQATVTGSEFSVVGGMASMAIAPGQSASIQIKFAPASASAATGSISIVSDAANSALSIPLTGTVGAAFAIIVPTKKPERNHCVTYGNFYCCCCGNRNYHIPVEEEWDAHSRRNRGMCMSRQR